MDPKIWGKHTWIFLHSITLNYPDNPTDEEITNHYNFFTNLSNILPCYKCREHYKLNLKKKKLTKKILKSKELFIKWLIDIHNTVNISNNKNIESYGKIMKYYDELYNNPSKCTNNILIYILIILIIIFILLIYFNKKK
jgi:FAD-linked sulfhydryl oxidase